MNPSDITYYPRLAQHPILITSMSLGYLINQIEFICKTNLNIYYLPALNAEVRKRKIKLFILLT